LRAENEKVSAALVGLRVENQTLKDEIARLKQLPPRPPMKPSGMERATDRPEGGAERDEDGASKRRRGPGVSKLSVDRTERFRSPLRRARAIRASRTSWFRTWC